MWVGGVRVIVRDNNNKLLLVKQSHDGKDIWMVPGGGIEEGENAREAAIREVKEETGLDIVDVKMLWHVEEVSQRGQRFVNFFMAKIAGGNLHLGSDPEFDKNNQVLRDVCFMTKQEIQKLENLYPESLRYELWDVLERHEFDYDAFRIR